MRSVYPSCVSVSFAKWVVNQTADEPHRCARQCAVCSVALSSVCCRPHSASFLLCMLLFKSGPAVFMNVFSGFPSVLNEMA